MKSFIFSFLFLFFFFLNSFERDSYFLYFLFREIFLYQMAAFSVARERGQNLLENIYWGKPWKTLVWYCSNIRILENMKKNIRFIIFYLFFSHLFSNNVFFFSHFHFNVFQLVFSALLLIIFLLVFCLYVILFCFFISNIK